MVLSSDTRVNYSEGGLQRESVSVLEEGVRQSYGTGIITMKSLGYDTNKRICTQKGPSESNVTLHDTICD